MQVRDKFGNGEWPTVATETQRHTSHARLHLLPQSTVSTPKSQRTTSAPSKRGPRALNEALEQMDYALNLASHELKTPLTTILGCLQLIGAKVDHLAMSSPDAVDVENTRARIYELLALATRGVDIEERLADDLVDAWRIQSAELTVRPEVCDLGQIVAYVVAAQRIASPKRLLHLDVPDQSIVVFADHTRVTQVVTNYLTNALKYSPKDRPVEVRVEVHPVATRVSVRDFGPGLEQEEVTRVWERFYQVPGARAHSTTSSGLGLGLYIARDRSAARRPGGSREPSGGGRYILVYAATAAR